MTKTKAAERADSWVRLFIENQKLDFAGAPEMQAASAAKFLTTLWQKTFEALEPMEDH